MTSKKEANFTSLIVGAVVIIMGVLSGITLHKFVSGLNGWQAMGYALISGVFIALTAAIINEILSFFYDD